ncbi:WhiB family transcriptional regulator [Streptomyces sp. 8N706]|uniref:WhiB family transcriptional regulator n=1 Tax=Streptomyces sp. 8N706 TaxID=3457416 RepID=UPI003FD21E47
MNWRQSAACRDEDPELFFPIGTSGPAALQAQEAKSVCEHCPVTEQCLEWALRNNQDSGVWGGLDENERRTLRRRTARARSRARR